MFAARHNVLLLLSPVAVLNLRRRLAMGGRGNPVNEPAINVRGRDKEDGSAPRSRLRQILPREFASLIALAALAVMLTVIML